MDLKPEFSERCGEVGGRLPKAGEIEHLKNLTNYEFWLDNTRDSTSKLGCATVFLILEILNFYSVIENG